MKVGPWGVAVCALVALGGCAHDQGDSGGSAASCASPSVVVAGTVALHGTVQVTGQAFFDGPCIDNQGFVDGTPEPSNPSGSTQPSTGLQLVWTQNGSTATLGTVDADAEGRFSVTVQVPVDAAAGAATIQVAPARAVEVDVTP